MTMSETLNSFPSWNYSAIPGEVVIYLRPSDTLNQEAIMQLTKQILAEDDHIKSVEFALDFAA